MASRPQGERAGTFTHSWKAAPVLVACQPSDDSAIVVIECAVEAAWRVGLPPQG